MADPPAVSAHSTIDWPELRRLSLEPGGFGDARPRFWPALLNVQPLAAPVRLSPEDKSHKDEHQIKLDTDRSFVLYPVDHRQTDDLKQELNELIVAVMRKRAKLQYFQGFHDIVSVLYLTLPLELAFPAVEKMSLHRLRDAMGPGLEPLMGQLRILKRLLRLADPYMAQLVESATPLPFYALSNLLTIFSHDVPTLPLIQRIFDYLLCRPPIASIYLSAVVILAHRDRITKLCEEGEEGMLHAVLTAFPRLEDEHLDATEPGPDEYGVQSHLDTDQTSIASESSTLASESSTLAAEIGESEEPKVHLSLFDATVTTSHEHMSNSRLASPLAERSPVSSAIEHDDDDLSTVADDVPPSRTLVDLLRQSDDLLARFPPSDPRLSVSRIMGPQSVLFTWTERHDDPNAIGDDEAEAMVDTPELVVQADFEDEDEMASQRDRRSGKRPSTDSTSMWWSSVSKEWQPSAVTVIAGVVLAVSIGIAVYDIQRRAQGRKDV